MPHPSPTLDKNLAPMGPGILSGVGVGVWRNRSGAFPDSNAMLDTCQSAMKPVTLQTVIRIFCLFVVAFSAISAFCSVESPKTLVFLGERDFPDFPHFPRIGFESLI